MKEKLYKDKDWLYQKYIVEKLTRIEIARLLNATKDNIDYWLKKFGLRNGHIGNRPTIGELENKNWLHREYVLGKKTAIQISKELNCDNKTVSYWLKKHNIAVRKEGPWKNKERPEFRGNKNPNWKNGRSALADTVRTSFKNINWRNQIYKRDNYTCQLCKKRGGGDLNVDHIKPLWKIIQDNNIKTIEEAYMCDELWNIVNGRTLCVQCHRKTKTYGKPSKNERKNQ